MPRPFFPFVLAAALSLIVLPGWSPPLLFSPARRVPHACFRQASALLLARTCKL